jgi:DNA-binding transcriptional LysR family regulator
MGGGRAGRRVCQDVIAPQRQRRGQRCAIEQRRQQPQRPLPHAAVVPATARLERDRQAAIAGQGIALTSLVLVSDALASGLLVQPFPFALRGATYHFASAPDLVARTDVVALRTWFQERLAAP